MTSTSDASWEERVVVCIAGEPIGSVTDRIRAAGGDPRTWFVLIELSDRRLALPASAVLKWAHGPDDPRAIQDVPEVQRHAVTVPEGAARVTDGGAVLRADWLDAAFAELRRPDVQTGGPFEDMAPDGPQAPVDYQEVSLFYATDRARSGDAGFNDFYSGDRGELEYGTARVSIPHDHRMGEIERPGWFRRRERPDKHVMLLDLDPLEGDELTEKLQADLSQASSRDVLLFVHGYNTSFAEAARRTAQLAYDLKFRGVPFMYSWPSDGKTANYTRDETDIEWGYEHFVEVLKTVLEQVGPHGTVHIVAHSMGNRTVVNALRELARMDLDPSSLARIRPVVLAAPDIDADIFVRWAGNVWPHAERLTLYSSSRDKALAASEFVHGADRAGRSDPLVLAASVDTIDATRAETDLLHHAYFGDNTSIITDIKNLIDHDETPDRRPGLRRRDSDAGVWWEMMV